MKKTYRKLRPFRSCCKFLVFAAFLIACCFVFLGCIQSADRISIKDITLDRTVVKIQSGVSKPLIATVEPYFASDPGVIFMEGNNSNGIYKLENHRMLQPWQFAVNVTAVGVTNGEASIIVKSIDGKSTKTIPVSMFNLNYNLKIRHMNTGTLNGDTTSGSGNPFEYKVWSGGKIPDAQYPVVIRNNETGARINNVNNDDCFPLATIVYLTHRDDNSGITGPFTFKMRFRFSVSSTNTDHGIFFGAYLDPEANLSDPFYYNENPNANRRFRVIGFRFIGSGAARNVFTTTGRPINELGWSQNPRAHGSDFASGQSFSLGEYTLQVQWDGKGRWTNTITNNLGISFENFIMGGDGWQSPRRDLTDPKSAFYPAFHIAGVAIEILELVIDEERL